MDIINAKLIFKTEGQEFDVKIIKDDNVYYLDYNGSIKPIYKQEYLLLVKSVVNDKIECFTKYGFLQKFIENRVPDRLEKIGQALYGRAWKKSLALALNIEERSILYYLRCVRKISTEVWESINKLVDLRLAEINQIKLSLAQHTD